MNFKNFAYLFDTSILGGTDHNSTRGVLSFIGNPLYLSAYAQETVEKIDFSGFDGKNFSDWANSSKQSEPVAQFLIKLSEEAGNLGLVTFFIEKDYASFLYLLGLMTTTVKVEDPDFRDHLDRLYQAYKTQYKEGIVRNEVDDTVTEFNLRIHHLLQTQKEHHFFKTLLSDHARDLDEQKTILHRIALDWKHDFLLADYFFYGQQLLKTYREKEIHDIYATSQAASQLNEIVSHTHKSSDIVQNIIEDFDEYAKNIENLARNILRICHYIIEKVISVNNVNEISEDDKYLFVIVWMILQSGDNNMFVNKKSYDMINEIFVSLKKEMNV